MLEDEDGGGAAGNADAVALLTELLLCASAATKLLRRAASVPPWTHPLPRMQPGDPRLGPVMLVHGLGADGSCFRSLEEKLSAAGHTTYCVNYSCLQSDVAGCGRYLERQAAWLLERSGSEQVHVVAHSLGGIVLRWAVTHTRMREWLNLGITLGTPHRGTPTALIAPSGLPTFGTLVRQLRPGLPELPDLEDGSRSRSRWVTVAGQRDWIVPPAYARLPPSGNVRNLVIPHSGHLQLTRDPRCHRIILNELAAAEVGAAQPLAA